jgi:uncharacterized protein with FMN-binding domain
MKKVALSALVIAASGAYVWSQAGAPDPLLQGMSADLRTGSIAPSTLTATGGTDLKPRDVPFVTGDTVAGDAPSATANQAPADQQSLPPLPAAGDSFAPDTAQTVPPASPATPAATQPAETAPADTPAPTGPVAVAEARIPADPAAALAPARTAIAVNVALPRLRPPYHRVAASAPTPAPASAYSSPSLPVVRVAATGTGLNDCTYTGPVVDAYYGLMQIEAVVQNGRLVTIHVLRFPNDRRTSIVINRQALPVLRDEVISAQSASVDIVSGATLTSEAFIQSLGAALDKARA